MLLAVCATKLPEIERLPQYCHVRYKEAQSSDSDRLTDVVNGKKNKYEYAARFSSVKDSHTM